MTHFIRLLTESNKATELLVACSHYRMNEPDHRYFDVLPEAFENVPGRPFAYWVSENVRSLFRSTPAFEGEGRVAQHGGSTKDDFRFLRVWWEQPNDKHKWTPFAKGGKFARFYSDVDLVVNWESDARELEAALLVKYPYLGENASWVLHRECRYGQAGITWPRRPSTGGCFWILPKGCIFSDNGPAAFLDSSNPTDIFAALAITNSKAFNALVQLLFSRGGAGSGQTMTYEVGYVGRTPFPHIENAIVAQLADEASRAWQLGRTLDSINETSHAFSLPFALRSRLGRFERPEIESGLADIQAKIDEVAFSLYRFNLADQQAADDAVMSVVSVTNVEDCDENGESAVADLLSFDSLLSWAVGVAFGRFDWRFATGDRPAPPDPDPFDPLPARSPGMLVAGAEPFFVHAGILNDDQGHLHDLVHLIEVVLGRVNMPVPDDVRRWLQRDFFAFHLQRYSKSRRKAPIYWPLATTSGSYTLWVYYPSLTSQTLYTAINDFVEPKLNQIGSDLATLRTKGATRSRDDEKRFETLQTLELELSELRDTLLRIAPYYHPNHDDGVQITAAPLWPLFRHKPWQKILKDTWTKLENGDYDWAHLALNYWPERVREKCKTDKSLAIAHGLEDLYVEPEAKPKKARGGKGKAA